jgi:hypothetical protein
MRSTTCLNACKSVGDGDGDRRIVLAGSTEIGVFTRTQPISPTAAPLRSVRQFLPARAVDQPGVDLIGPDRTHHGPPFSDEVHFVCPWHAYEYELRTGECVGDRRLRLKRFEVVRRGDDIFVIA